MSNNASKCFLRYVEKQMIANQAREDIYDWEKEINAAEIGKGSIEACREEFKGVTRMLIEIDIHALVFKYECLAGVPF